MTDKEWDDAMARIAASPIKSIVGCLDDNGNITTGGGRMICLQCGALGFKCRHYHLSSGIIYKEGKRWQTKNQRLSFRCVKCGSSEIHDNYTGEILSQKKGGQGK